MILADEMGLGKTVQAAVAIQRLFDCGAVRRALIVCPASLLLNWRAELRTWAPSIPAVLYRGADRFGLLEGTARLLITTYETLTGDLARQTLGGKLFVDVGIDLLILDEAQYIKTPETTRSMIITRLVAGRRWALTGTPLENHPRELASILRFLFPNEYEELESADIVPRLLAHRDACMVRRTKAGVGLQLPTKRVSYTLATLTPDQDAEYQNALAEIKEQIISARSPSQLTSSLIGGLQNLRRISAISANGESGKLDLLDAELDEITDSDEKIVVFSSFPHLVFPHALSRFSRFGVVQYTGEMSVAERNQVHERFINDPTTRVMLASLKAAGVGVTWTVASFVYQLDIWWNPQVMKQAEDRVHRIGQTRPVLAKRLISEGTIDEGIRRLAEKKEDIFDFLIDDHAATINQTSMLDQLLPLIGLRLEDLTPSSHPL